jgi:hypothetical protein
MASQVGFYNLRTVFRPSNNTTLFASLAKSAIENVMYHVKLICNVVNYVVRISKHSVFGFRHDDGVEVMMRA